MISTVKISILKTLKMKVIPLVLPGPAIPLTDCDFQEEEKTTRPPDMNEITAGVLFFFVSQDRKTPFFYLLSGPLPYLWKVVLSIPHRGIAL